MGKDRFFEIYCQNGGKITSIKDYLKIQESHEFTLLFGGFIQDFLDKIPSLQTKANVFLLHPLNFNPLAHIRHFLYEVGCEEIVAALLLESLLKNRKNPEITKFLATLDVGYLTAEINLSEEELLEIEKSFFDNPYKTFIIGRDLYNHKKSENIARILAFLSQEENIRFVFLEDCVCKNPLEQQAIREIDEVLSYDGMVVYLQENTGLKNPILRASRQFALVGKILDSKEIKIKFLENKKEIKVGFENAPEIKGMVGILWLPKLEDSSFCYQQIIINEAR